MVRDRGEAVIQAIELVLGKIEAGALRAFVERVASAVLTQYQLAFGNADGARVDDFVGGFFLEVAVLMDAGLVREGVAAHNCLIGLRPEGDDGAEQFAGGIEMLGVDSRVVGVAIGARLEDHHDLFKRAVARALANPVDGAFDLACAGLDGGERVGNGEAEIVVAVYADDGAIA